MDRFFPAGRGKNIELNQKRVMKTRLLILIIFMGLFNVTFSQQTSKLDKWNWLIGEWKDIVSRQSGNESITFSFVFDLDKKVIVRKSNRKYIDKTDGEKTIHQDLTIIYPDQSGKPDRAICFDNEGHIINYKVTFEGKSVIFKNYDRGNSPVYRLTYIRTGDETISRKFEFSRDGENFTTYEEGNSIKIK
jgi:hypothetical protein